MLDTESKVWIPVFTGMTQIADLSVKTESFYDTNQGFGRKILVEVKFYDTKRGMPRGINPTICKKITLIQKMPCRL